VPAPPLFSFELLPQATTMTANAPQTPRLHAILFRMGFNDT
jgi:hypothetical protein